MYAATLNSWHAEQCQQLCTIPVAVVQLFAARETCLYFIMCNTVGCCIPAHAGEHLLLCACSLSASTAWANIPVQNLHDVPDNCVAAEIQAALVCLCHTYLTYHNQTDIPMWRLTTQVHTFGYVLGRMRGMLIRGV
eukprot:TRINITY_DN14800_c0_g1_i1.p2 TRINITY_DN14800_c0_g1~~TRINITY_DN14800_c0_g1_i1.p2  ORF type:complete len:136 (-),score=2.29 TRINITY_DN14800_c0_g1_i1:293-700(-)